MSTIQKLFQDIQALPDDFTVKGEHGSGPFAREIDDEHPHMQKIILSGDTKQTVMLALWYLLYDLAVDCNWPEQQIEALRIEFFGS